MDRLRRFFLKEDSSGRYEPVGEAGVRAQPKFNWIEYVIFMLLGVAMLWAWNMFLAAAPYFISRFAGNQGLSDSFQSAELAVSTVANLASMLVLTKMQKNASYPSRIALSLVLNVVCFTFLAVFTVAFLDIPQAGYYAFLMVMVLTTSIATGLCQNGVFAYASSFGVGEYTQAIMTGQGIAGVLPPLVKIVSALSVPQEQIESGAQESPTSACAYFGTAAGVSAVALIAFGYLLYINPLRNNVYAHASTNTSAGIEQNGDLSASVDDMAASQISQRKVLGLWALFKKLRWLAVGVIITFAVTLSTFPVFTSKILSVQDPETSSRIFQPAAFIPLGFLLWNIGDLIGRTLPLIPAFNIVHRPKLVTTASLSRIIFIPLYFLCNIRGKGAVVDSDLFYLLVVQLLFGLTNGWLGATCMMGSAYWVEEDEREASGAFMGLMLVSGLTLGSLLSFAVAA